MNEGELKLQKERQIKNDIKVNILKRKQQQAQDKAYVAIEGLKSFQRSIDTYLGQLLKVLECILSQ